MSDLRNGSEVLPIVVIGAGPVGLAAAAHLTERGLPVQVFEQGKSAGWALREWEHVRFFSPWEYLVDGAARRILERGTWRAPDPEGLPTAKEFVDGYLAPLSKTPELSTVVSYGRKVLGLGRLGAGKVHSRGRVEAPFQIHWSQDGEVGKTLARAVVDTSGTWFNPNPLGADGIPVPGENLPGIRFGIPDILGAERSEYAEKSVLVVGSGHSAMHSVLNLLRLKENHPKTRILWAHRRESVSQLGNIDEQDFLSARADLNKSVLSAIQTGAVELRYGFSARRVEQAGDGLRVFADQAGAETSLEVDRIVVATGFRPDLSLFRELRTDVDPVLEAPVQLAPLIDPNIHSCGSVPPHGVEQLTHTESSFFVAGAKSYGRAPTFLMVTGYEQVRSIAAELAGDRAAARRVELVLPASGACGVGSAEGSGCCGGPAKSDAGACCVKDETAKAAGLSGCGCSR